LEAAVDAVVLIPLSGTMVELGPYQSEDVLNRPVSIRAQYMHG
jgi:hypothetical protein